MRALEIARRLSLLPRITARTSREQLRRELGGDAAATVEAEERESAAVGLALGSVARQVASIAESNGIRLALLKHAALDASQVILPGSRIASDVDVLAPASSCQALADVLQRSGFQPTGLPSYEHQLAALAHPSGIGVEVHRVVLGVRVARGSATLEDLDRAGLLERGPYSSVLVPSRELLLAHALVHGISQHGAEPASYPFLRMVSDVIDIVAAPLSSGWRSRLSGLTGGELSDEEIDAALELARRLVAGDARGLAEDAPARALLLHAIAGVEDVAYAETGRLGGWLDAPSDRARPVRLAGAAIATLFPRRAQLLRIYGARRTGWGYLALYAYRPFDLLRRFLRYALAAHRHRRRP